jgi:hypothetical protein
MRRPGVGAIVLAVAALWVSPSLAQQEHAPVAGDPKEAWKEKEDPLHAKGLKDCKVGDRVTASYDGQWVPVEVIEVDAAAPYPCKVHPIGGPPTGDASFSAWMLRPQTERP